MIFPWIGTFKDPNKSHRAKTNPPERLIAIAPLNPNPSELLFFADLLNSRAIPIPKKRHQEYSHRMDLKPPANLES